MMASDTHIKGWKGKDNIKILEEFSDYRIIEHRKTKSTGKVTERISIVPKKKVDALWDLMRFKLQLGEIYGSKYIYRMIIEHYKFHETENAPFDLFLEAFNGGRFRNLYYFPFFYNPIRVLHHQGKIRYEKKTITRLR